MISTSALTISKPREPGDANKIFSPLFELPLAEAANVVVMVSDTDGKPIFGVVFGKNDQISPVIFIHGSDGKISLQIQVAEHGGALVTPCRDDRTALPAMPSMN